MKKLKNLKPNTTAYVLAHWEWRKSRGKKNPSVNFDGIKNPRKSLELAQGVIRDNSELRGNPFVGELFIITNPKDLAYGEEPCPRKCSLCFYRDGERNPERKCQIVSRESKHPNELFGFDKNEFMPMVLDEKEVGHYCPEFLPFYAD